MRTLALVLGLGALSTLGAQGEAQKKDQQSVAEKLPSTWTQLTDGRGFSILHWAETLPWPEGTTQLLFTLRRTDTLTTVVTVTPSPLRLVKPPCERPAKVVCYDGENIAWEHPCCAGPISDCGLWVDFCLEEGRCPQTVCFARLYWSLSGPATATPASEATRRFLSAAQALPLAPYEYLSIVWKASSASQLIVDTVRLVLRPTPENFSALHSMPLHVGVGIHFLGRGPRIPRALQQNSAYLQATLPKDGCTGKEECLQWLPTSNTPYSYLFMATRMRPRPPHQPIAKASFRPFPGKVVTSPDGTLSVELPWTGPWTLRVWDLQGRLIETLTAQGPSVQLTRPLAPGDYRLQLLSPAGEVHHHTFVLSAYP